MVNTFTYKGQKLHTIFLLINTSSIPYKSDANIYIHTYTHCKLTLYNIQQVYIFANIIILSYPNQIKKAFTYFARVSE